MPEPSYFERAQIERQKAIELGQRIPQHLWVPDNVVCERPPAYSGAKIFARMVTLQRQIERMIEGSTKP